MGRARYLSLVLLVATSCQSRLVLPNAYYCNFVDYGGSPGANFCQGWFYRGGDFDIRTVGDDACRAELGGTFAASCPTSDLLGRCDIEITSGNVSFASTFFMPSKPCQADADCGGGITCQNQVCADVVCTDGSNCGPGSLCNANACTNFCTSAVECGDAFVCAGLSCNVDADCMAGLSCPSGVCTMACNTSADCIGKVPCQNNLCQYGICAPEYWTPANASDFCSALNKSSGGSSDELLSMTATWTAAP